MKRFILSVFFLLFLSAVNPLRAEEKIYLTQPQTVICATLEDIMAVYRYGQENDMDSYKAIVKSGRCNIVPKPIKLQKIESLGIYAGVGEPGQDILPGSSEVLWMLNDHLKPAS